MLDDETPPEEFIDGIRLDLAAHQAFQERIGFLGDDQLDIFLDHVRRTVPYYRELDATRPLRALADFPLVDRESMRARRDAFLSEPYLDEGKRFFGRTNGTMSVPLKVAYDLAGYYDSTHFVLARIAATVPGLLDELPGGEVGVCVISDRTYVQRSTVLVPALAGTLLRRLPIGRSREDDADVVAYLRRERPPLLCGKPHVLLRLAEIEDAAPAGERYQPRALLSTSTSLYGSDRRRLEQRFGCRVIDAYTSTEAGLIAVDCTEQPGLHVQSDRVVLEVERADGSFGFDGTGELVLTNMMNWAHAVVRYRIGDRAEVAFTRCACGFEGQTLVGLPTRDLDGYDVPGVGRVRSSELETILADDELRQYEVSQPDGHDLVVRVMPAVAAPQALLARLEQSLAARLGRAFQLQVSEQITLVGGKLLRFVKTPPRRFSA